VFRYCWVCGLVFVLLLMVCSVVRFYLVGCMLTWVCCLFCMRVIGRCGLFMIFCCLMLKVCSLLWFMMV